MEQELTNLKAMYLRLEIQRDRLRDENVKLAEDKSFWFDTSSKYALEIEILTKAHVALIEAHSKLRTEHDVLSSQLQRAQNSDDHNFNRWRQAENKCDVLSAEFELAKRNKTV